MRAAIFARVSFLSSSSCLDSCFDPSGVVERKREGVADVILADGDRAQGWAGPFGDRDDYSWRHACLQS